MTDSTNTSSPSTPATEAAAALSSYDELLAAGRTTMMALYPYGRAY